MSGYRLPAPAGRWIRRDQPMTVHLNGQALPAFAGDTLASAALAAGVRTLSRSFKLHRPRGVFGMGAEEPSALVDVGQGARRTPNTRATECPVSPGLVAKAGNAWPNVNLDLAAVFSLASAVLPAGFYYKTFFWPRWRVFEPVIRALAGLGHAPSPDAARDPQHYDEVSREVELLVVGGGVAGMTAALAAARSGQEVLLMDDAAQLGGWAVGCSGEPWDLAQDLAGQLAARGVQVLSRCAVFGLYDHGFAAAIEQVGGEVGERLWKVRARRIVLATGAVERPMLFPDNDRPGVMLASAVQRYAALYGVASGRRVVIAGACDSAYGAAHELLAAGVHVAAIVDHRPSSAARAPEGVAVHTHSAIVAVRGRHGVEGVTVAPQGGGALLTLDADCVASAGGWTPAVQLYAMAGGLLTWDGGMSMFRPGTSVGRVAVVGAAAGVFALDAACEHAAGVGANGPKPAPAGGLGPVSIDLRPDPAAIQSLGRRPGRIFVDLQNDVTADDLALAARENYRSVEHLKRYTTTGMGTDQGRTSNVNALVLMGQFTGRAPGEVGTTRFRPPVRPVTLNAIAAGRHGERIKPLRRLPGQDWHLGQGALMEEFGGWLRPAAYPRAGEDMHRSAQREARQVRLSAGVFEGSPLGKIEVYGPDAGAFLDRMYVGTMSTLAVGRARYGLLLNEHGVIVDDGIVARLSPFHFWVHTTSGAAQRVAQGFEEWWQGEFRQMQVLIVPVTSDWGNVAVHGPQAWPILAEAGFDDALSPSEMAHMTVRDTTWRNRPARVLRASYTGEIAYEINVRSDHTLALLEAVHAAGQSRGLATFGVEALNILRIEKGYLHVGSDTDGTTLPGDVGMDGAVAAKKADFVGRRSLMRPSALDADRLQWVGLRPLDRRTVLPVGAHVCAQRPPADSEGYVTSSCYSPSLEEPVAMGMLRRGRARIGEQITVWHLGSPLPAEVCMPGFMSGWESSRGR